MAGFTLIELLVVMAILSLLVAMLMPCLVKAKSIARDVTCRSMVHAQGRALHLYAAQENGALACGSTNELEVQGYGGQGPISRIANFQIWLGLNEEFCGLGVLAKAKLLDGGSLFCPQDPTADALAQWEILHTRAKQTAYCSYLYRQLDGQESDPPRTQMGDLGLNTAKGRVNVLVMDMHNTLYWPGLPMKIPHLGEKSTALRIDGSVSVIWNKDQCLTLRQEDDTHVYDRLDVMFENADEQK
jgi:prepilin-type N-terminal cleavage/methylation domain-containing protein